MKTQFNGTGVALVTPFHKYGTIDFTSIGKILEYVISNGADFILALGTSGEWSTLSSDEKGAVIDFVVETVDKRLPVIVGIGGNNTQDVVNNIKGVGALMSVCPYYNKPNQKGIYLHYKIIASASPVPVFLYNVPLRTNVNITAETTLKLAAEHKNIIGIKEASGNLVQCMEIIKNKPEHFSVLAGYDLLALPILSLGAEGAISVTANAFPLEYSTMVKYCLNKDIVKGREIFYKLLEFMQTLFADGSPGGIKAALEIMGMCKNNLRLPLVKVNKSVYNQLNALIAKLN